MLCILAVFPRKVNGAGLSAFQSREPPHDFYDLRCDGGEEPSEEDVEPRESIGLVEDCGICLLIRFKRGRCLGWQGHRGGLAMRVVGGAVGGEGGIGPETDVLHEIVTGDEADAALVEDREHPPMISVVVASGGIHVEFTDEMLLVAFLAHRFSDASSGAKRA